MLAVMPVKSGLRSYGGLQSKRALALRSLLHRLFSKMSIAYKEADETDYWLNLLHDNGYLNESQYESLKKDIDRILKLLTSIVKTMNQKVKGK